jgi:signal transduction histidine kinase/ligand-binding sensor domain-containing protein/DNA-binding response OmpR family regulator
LAGIFFIYLFCQNLLNLIKTHKYKLVRFSRLGILFLSIFLFSAQNNIFGQKSIPFFRIGTAQGLSQSTVFCSFQDSRGFLWFGTAEGLNRYDGYGFKVFRHVLNDSTSLGSNDILTIAEDATGNIWVGTRTRGLSILDRNTLKFDNTLNKQKNLNTYNTGISTILKDKNDNMWFTANNIGLFIQKKYSNKISKINSQLTKNITAAFIDKSGAIWYGNLEKQLIKIEAGQIVKTFQIFKSKSQVNSNISGITKAKSGNLYITTSSNGLFSLNEATNTTKNCYYKPAVLDGPNNMKAIVCDKENNLLITSNDGLIIIKNENFENIAEQKANSTKRFALSTHALLSIIIDKNENIWIGTWEGGINVNYKKQPAFGLFRHEVGAINGPLERKITSVAANNNSVWMGTNIGLTEFNKKNQTWRHLNKNQLSGIDINVTKFDRDEDLFISAYQKDLNVYFSKKDQVKQYKINNIKTNSSITAFAKENNGKMWVGTSSNGVFLFDKTTGKFESLKNQIKNINIEYIITAILQDNKNRLWIGTVANGIYLVDLNRNDVRIFKNGDSKKTLSDEHIFAFHQDKLGNIWVGTNGGGLNLFNEKENTFTAISELNGLPNNTIKSIIEDNEGNLWLSTNKGICRFNYPKNEFISYNETDGLQGNEFGRAVGTQNEAGEIFLGGTNGLTYFNPNDLKLKTGEAPTILFTDLKLFNKSVEINKNDSPLKTDISLINELVLKNSQSVFTVDYLAMDFQQLKNYQYAYKLEGFDTDWNYVGTQRSASYTNMHEGTYYLQVKATNNTGIWAEKITSLKIIILPPWYRTIWAYLAYTLFLGLSLYFWRKIISVRERLQADIRIQKIEANKIKELDIAKTNFFTNISHEFRTPLTLIISPIQHLLNSFEAQPEVLNKQHSIILNNAQRLLRLINQILDISKIEAGNMQLEISKNDIVEFLGSIALSFKVLASKNNINFNFNVKNTIRYCYFDKDIIEKIAYNLLSNAFKFTPENGKIDFNIAISNQILKIEVVDNGIGMDPETCKHIFERYFQGNGKKERKSIGTGIGLALTKELTELHLGTIEVESEPNLGSKFTIEIPINPVKFDPILIKENFNFDQETQQYHELAFGNISQEISLENNNAYLLIVEDNDELREYLADLFIDKYRVLQASNGKDGLKIAIETLPDIILSDYIMPIMDGGEFCKAIKTNEKTSHIPFILLTSKQNSNTIADSFEIGADDYITKPFNVSLLLKRIANILKNRALFKQKFGQVTELIPQEVIQNDTEEKFYKKIISIIETNMFEPTFDVSELENKLNMSKMQLYRKLKGVSNLAPNEFIRNVRLKKAATIMQNTTLNISEIAFKVGFNDPAYFARCFRKEFGKSPTDYFNQKAN